MEEVATPSMGRFATVAMTLLVLSAIVSVPWSIHNLTMLADGENFGWGVFAIFFFDAPMALVQLVLSVILTTRLERVPKAAVIGAWLVTVFTAGAAICVVAFGKASGC
jgi:hypothetical protein